MTEAGLTIIIPTLNEEKNLGTSLASARRLTPSVFVVDSGSTDRTHELALQHGATYVEHAWEGHAKQKNWALANLAIRTEWVMFLDADETIPEALRDEITRVTTAEVGQHEAVGYYVNRFLVWRGREIRHSGYYPSWNLRLFRRGTARYEERAVHEHMIVTGAVGYLESDLRHEDLRGRDYVWEKHLRYAQLEAAEMLKARRGVQGARLQGSLFGNAIERRRFVKDRVWPYLPARWFWRFLYMFGWKQGFRDGRPGLDLCIFMARYEMEISRNVARQRCRSRS